MRPGCRVPTRRRGATTSNSSMPRSTPDTYSTSVALARTMTNTAHSREICRAQHLSPWCTAFRQERAAGGDQSKCRIGFHGWSRLGPRLARTTTPANHPIKTSASDRGHQVLRTMSRNADSGAPVPDLSRPRMFLLQAGSASGAPPRYPAAPLSAVRIGVPMHRAVCPHRITVRVPHASDMRGILRRQCEIERRTLSHLALGPHAAAVPADDPLDDGQPDAGAGEILGSVQPLEHAEQLVDIAACRSPRRCPSRSRRCSPPPRYEPTSISAFALCPVNLIALSSRLVQTRCIISGSPRTCGSGPTFTSMSRPAIAGASSLSVAWTSTGMSISAAAISRRGRRARTPGCRRSDAPSCWRHRARPDQALRLRVQLVAVVFLQHRAKSRRSRATARADRATPNMRTTPVPDWRPSAPGWPAPDRPCARQPVPPGVGGAAPVRPRSAGAA